MATTNETAAIEAQYEAQVERPELIRSYAKRITDFITEGFLEDVDGLDLSDERERKIAIENIAISAGSAALAELTNFANELCGE